MSLHGVALSNTPEVKLSVESQENLVVIDEGSNELGVGPFRLSKILLGKLIPSTLICGVDFCYVAVKDGSVEVENELFGNFMYVIQPRNKKPYTPV